jgi:amino acid adenylation domain-containing protein
MDDVSRQVTDLSRDRRELLELLLSEEDDDLNSFPLSYAQQRLWFLDQLEPGCPAYNISTAVRLSGPLDIDTLKRSLNEIVRRHESLRTTFTTIEGRPVQVIAPSLMLPLPLIDLLAFSLDERESEALLLMSEEARRAFDLEHGPLLRVTALRRGNQDHIIQLTMHHIVSDGWSMSVFIHEMATLYEAFSKGEPSPLPELPIQYADFVHWEQQHLQDELVERQLAYWKRQLGGDLPVLPLPTDRPRPAVQTYRGARLPVSLPLSLTESLKALSQSEGATLFMTLLAAFQALLSRYTNQEDISIGSSIAGRTRAETEGLIGFFLNTMVLRTDLSGNPGFLELLKRVREVALGAYSNQDVPVEMLLEALHPERNSGHNPLFQVLFILQNTPAATLKITDVTLQPIELDTNTAKFDLTLDLTEQAEGIQGWLEYNTDLFDVETVTGMMHNFQTLLESIIADPRQRLASLALLTSDQRDQLVSHWNQTSVAGESGLCLHQLFERQAERTPDASAVIFDQEQLTYGELNARSNRLANYLRRIGVGPEVLVGLLMERSVEMITSMLGILKAGGAYLPLDPAFPPERLSLILRDSGARIVLTQARLRNRFSGQPVTLVCLDTDEKAIAKETSANRPSIVEPQNLAYVIYTSGSSGIPKGVQTPHSAVVNYVEAAGVAYELRSHDRVLQFASISFDASAEEIYPCLSCGATLVLRTEEMLASPAGFLEKCQQWQITVLDLPTAYWHELVAGLGAEIESFPPSIRLVIIGGERALPERLADWQRHVSKSVRLVNSYGPTEATIVATMCDLPREENGGWIARREVSIGRPVRNAQAYILDQLLNPVPVGVAGQLYLGGSGLARGYLRRAELTADKFIAHPFSLEAGARLYATGDFARYRADGQIEFVGRIDNQVKVRGFRIELGEIEAALHGHSAVREAVVEARDDAPGVKRLVAYIVARPQAAPALSEIRNHLKQQLPDFMIPSAFVMLDALPLTTGGKLDRRALPPPGDARPDLEEGFAAPRTPTEEVLAAIWAEVLGLKQVGVHDNFFDLGGHSLLATQVISRIRESFCTELPLRSIFEVSTLADLADRIEIAVRAEQGLELPPIKPAARDADLPLSFAQERLWFLHQLDPESAAYHVLRPMRISGVLDVNLLERAFTEIVRRHEIYRTSFPAIAGRPVQMIDPPFPVTLARKDLRGLPEAEREASVQRLIEEEGQRPFDLAQGPLWRLALLRLGDDDHLLMLTEHHMVHDGWTEGTLVREFLALYSSFSEGAPSPLPELPIQYSDFGIWQRECLQGPALEAQLAYWKKQLSGTLPVLELPTDRPRLPVQTFRGETQTVMLPAPLAQHLYELSRRNHCTLFMTTLAAFSTLLHRYSGQDDILVGSPIAGRNRAELENLIGFFVNTMVLRNDLSGDPTFLELLKRTREVSLGAYAHQDMPFEKLVEEIQPERDLSRQALFQVMFVLHNAPRTNLEIAGLTIDAMRVHNRTSKFDLLFSIREEEEGLRCVMEYSTDLFDDPTIARMMAQFQTLLEGIVADPEQRISDLPLLTDAEELQLLSQWNETRADYPRDRLVHQLFEAQVKRTPDDVAVSFGNEQLTYRELNAKANRLAHYLRAQGVGTEKRVAICIKRSPEMIGAVLGVLKSGGAYVALDAAYPQERLAYMLEDADVVVVLTQKTLASALPQYQATVVCLDADWEVIARESEENPTSMGTAESLVYVTYTSGSTGKPKGIAMIQRPLLNLLGWMIRHTRLPERARTLQFASLSFDVSFQDIFSTLCSGGTVEMISESERQDISNLAKILTAREVHRIFIPAVALQQLAEGFCAQGNFNAPLRKVIAGSEQLQITQAISTMFGNLDQASLHNEYGPSEAHVVTELALPKEPDNWPQRPAIGRPIANTQIYLLDRNFKPTPIGVPGELHIGGAGLARGYLTLPDVTADKFIPDPFSPEPGARLYRTGDLARYLPDGSIEFLGRMDHQLKIRGFRIEPGEIEVVLGQHPAIQEALVMAYEHAPGDKRLVAYVVIFPEAKPTGSELRAHLKEKLPDYMVPSTLILLDALPLTPNGKVDRGALPVPEQLRPDLEQAFVAPNTRLEEVLAKMWVEVLGLERVGVNDNFFELGGHSLLATQLMSRVSEAFQTDLPLRIIFESPTVSSLAERMRQTEARPGDFEEMARILEQLDALTEEEAMTMLGAAKF